MPFEEGYYAGLVNDRACPRAPFTLASILWLLGNEIGVAIHCALVEAVYLNSVHD